MEEVESKRHSIIIIIIIIIIINRTNKSSISKYFIPLINVCALYYIWILFYLATVVYRFPQAIKLWSAMNNVTLKYEPEKTLQSSSLYAMKKTDINWKFELIDVDYVLRQNRIATVAVQSASRRMFWRKSRSQLSDKIISFYYFVMAQAKDVLWRNLRIHILIKSRTPSLP
jgi:IS4 transposase